MARRSNGLSYVLIGIAAGAAGAAAGILFAPASGRETRRQIGRRFREETKALKKNGRKLIDDWSEAAQERFEEGKEKLSQMLHS
jgi:gas vesicle protein